MSSPRAFIAVLLAFLVVAPAALADGNNNNDNNHRGDHHGTPERFGGLFTQLGTDLMGPGVPPLAAQQLIPLAREAARKARRNPCAAGPGLDALRAAIDGFALEAMLAATLGTDVLQIQVKLQTACAGGRGHDDNNDENHHGNGGRGGPAGPAVQLMTSDTGGFTARITLPPANFAPRVGDGQPFTAFTMDGMGSGGSMGAPSLPTLTRFFATPDGTSPEVEILDSSSYDLGAVMLWPKQDQPADATGEGDPFGDPPFAIDRKAYDSDASTPSSPAAARSLGTMRDVNVGGVETDGGQYTPLTRSLRVFTSFLVHVRFATDGETQGTTFAPASVLSGWERSSAQLYQSSLINWSTAIAHLGPNFGVRFCGEELRVITSHGLRSAADSLAVARTGAGFVSRVVEVGGGVGQIGTTPAAIQTFIRGELTRGCVWRPSYVAIVGDVDQVPTNLVTTPWASTGFDGMIATDLPYALENDSDLLPDLAIGRIPARTLTEANAVVTKIVNYEQHPPTDSAFYDRAALTSYFQGPGPMDQRGFAKTSQTIANALEADGRTVDRIYRVDSAAVNPTTWYDGTAVPASLRRPGFGWNGTTANLVSAWNAGRFIVFHRDHGAPFSWGNPDFDTSNQAALANGDLLPVVFAVNCASGFFDGGSQSLDERLLLMPTGGAVGVVGDSRNSPSFTNNHIALGMFDAIFPNVLPSYGSAGRIRRMGDVLVAGKRYMNTQNGIDLQDDQQTRAELYLYHWFGDPTMELRLTAPLSIFARVAISRLVLDSLVLQLAQGQGASARRRGGHRGHGGRRHRRNIAIGAWATVFQDGQPIGRGLVGRRGQVSIHLDAPLDPNAKSLELMLDDPRGVPQTLAVPPVQL